MKDSYDLGLKNPSRRSLLVTALAVSVGAGISLIGGGPALADEMVAFADRPKCIA
ncbi:hypothetical protein RCH12_000906 [Cryobacterium sp. MP_3.1]|uniref:hypothetical protein n=1 Tax=Cryobacterium TaxID=69578 RepID=UPI0013FDF5C8|nr:MULTISPECIES: hypothetical protein [Cryobacterium]MEC5183451.1 hypothetical protein [Cryobacterium sp. MP_3.1]